MITKIFTLLLPSFLEAKAKADDYDVCHDFFQEKFLACVASCESADPVCFANCNRELLINLEKCPGQTVEG